LNIEAFYSAIRYDDEPDKLPTMGDASLTYGTKRLLKLFKEKGHKSLFISRNLPVFFLGPIWFLYRRLYLLAALMPLVGFLIEYSLSRNGVNVLAIEVIEFCFTVYVSLFANSLYINNTRRRFAKGYNSNPSRIAVYLGIGSALLTIVVALIGLELYLLF
jgi:hypothetical protein